MIRRLGTSIYRWLDGAPIADPLDRRNAPVMQLLLLFIGILLPLNWAYHLLVVRISHWQGRDALFAADMATSAVALGGVWLIRRGRFGLAIRLLLAALLLTAAMTATVIGFAMLMYDQSNVVLSLIIGGLIMGRRTLWAIFATQLAIFAVGMTVDAIHLATMGKPALGAFGNGPSIVLTYLVITVVIDRCVSALRESLQESNARGQQLQREMAERERTQAKLLHAQKMEAVGRVASGVAHDFQNIIGVILGFSTRRERLADTGAPALLDALEGVELAARRASAISRKLLSFSRNDVPTPETFDAALTLHELSPMLRQLFGHSVRLRIEDAAARVLRVRMDRGQFELMVLNIAANARDAMRDGGVFTITMDSDANERFAVIQLIDNGGGMDEDVRARIFEPFYTTKAPGEGTGLGLSVVRDLVEEANGEIEANSTPGQGTTFVLRLPLVG
ncbi:ATP-binding protein [Dyella sp. GSA-30]|uniref:sensor histidine kinase n=1 Tax=Dyella sp. GSA-30 TaxID=2994496 RepID=UPI0024904576|nr:ATP-binding protein [Dyella sp. GSA-30]